MIKKIKKILRKRIFIFLKNIIIFVSVFGFYGMFLADIIFKILE